MHHSLLGYPRQLGGSVFDAVCLAICPLIFLAYRIIDKGYTILLFSFPFFQQPYKLNHKKDLFDRLTGHLSVGEGWGGGGGPSMSVT